MKFLITGFDPFGGESVNPAWQAVQQLPKTIAGHSVCTLMIPTVFHKSIEVLMHGIAQHQPDAVLCVGQAGGRFDITLERIAINIDDARICDNEGNQPIDIPIYKQGENAYFSNLPIKRIVSALKEQGIPASVSNTAGTFVCNHLLYALLHHINKKLINVQYGGFVHVPYIPEQVVNKPNTPSLEISRITKALQCIIETMDISVEDITVSGGKEF